MIKQECPNLHGGSFRVQKIEGNGLFSLFRRKPVGPAVDVEVEVEHRTDPKKRGSILGTCAIELAAQDLVASQAIEQTKTRICGRCGDQVKCKAKDIRPMGRGRY